MGVNPSFAEEKVLRLSIGRPKKKLPIINPGLALAMESGVWAQIQNRGVAIAPAVTLGNLDDMASTGQNSTDFLGAGVQKKNYPAVKIHPGKLEGGPQKFSRVQGK